MSEDSFARWQEHNREFLALAVDELQERMQGHVAEDDRAAAFAAQMEHPPALHVLARSYELDPFEIDLVLLCFASELDPRFRADPSMVTVGFAVEALEGAHWAALDDTAPLRRSGILRIEPDAPLANAPMRLAHDVVRFLMGFDPREGDDTVFALAAGPAPPSTPRVALAQELAVTVRVLAELSGRPPAVELHGATEEDRLEVALLCADAMEHALACADLPDLPAPGPELDQLLRQWNRQGRLTGTALCIGDADVTSGEPDGRSRTIAHALAAVDQPLFIMSRRSTVGEPDRPVVRRAVVPMTAGERLEVWEACVAQLRRRDPEGWAQVEDGDLAALAGDFRFGSRSIERITRELEAKLVMTALAEAPLPPALEPELRAGCAEAARAKLDPVADRVRSDRAHDVILPEREADQLREFEQRIRLHPAVTAGWGVGSEHDGGLTALFAGPSGTGKTHAALAIARRLGHDLYRVNLASVLSKYIGETEKNVDRIFDAAQIGGVILLFDEADALFGKRSEVKDSHDRYANIGTAHLLARLESTAVPTILTTNIKDAIDPAFLRRLSFVVDFPFPGAAEREEIWRGIYPEQAPVGELEPERLAVLAATGGVISNIARRGAFLAAAEPSAIELRHLRESAERELRKSNRELTHEERSAWNPSR